MHVPSEVVSAQDWHAPVQALLQQIPWAQVLLAHSVPFEQDAPSPFRPQLELMQTLGEAHCASFEQLERQRVPVHMFGKHASGAGVAH